MNKRKNLPTMLAAVTEAKMDSGDMVKEGEAMEGEAKVKEMELVVLTPLHLENYLKTRQSQVCLGTLKDAQEFGQFLGNTRLPKHPG